MLKSKPGKTGNLIVISGPSGVGKGTLVGMILKRVPGVFLSVSATTRKPRRGEVIGRDYFFLSTPEFRARIETGAFLEWAQVYQDFYGTPLEPINKALDEGKTVILEIDVQGAMKVKDRIGAGAKYVFIAPPSLQELGRRLSGRKTESQEARRERLNVAQKELNLADQYDYVIINDDLEKAADILTGLIAGIGSKED